MTDLHLKFILDVFFPKKVGCIDVGLRSHLMPYWQELMPSEIPPPWFSGPTLARIIKTSIPFLASEKVSPDTSRKSKPASKPVLMLGSIFCWYKLMQVSVTVFSSYISHWSILLSSSPQNMCCTFWRGCKILCTTKLDPETLTWWFRKWWRR